MSFNAFDLNKIFHSCTRPNDSCKHAATCSFCHGKELCSPHSTIHVAIYVFRGGCTMYWFRQLRIPSNSHKFNGVICFIVQMCAVCNDNMMVGLKSLKLASDCAVVCRKCAWVIYLLSRF